MLAHAAGGYGCETLKVLNEALVRIECRHANISLKEGPSSLRIQELGQGVVKRQGFDQDYYELSDLLFITPFSWPAFLDWDRRFFDACFEPRNWAPAEGLEFKDEWQPAFDRLRSAPPSVLKPLIEKAYPRPASAFTEIFGQPVVAQLLAGGFASLMSQPFEKLDYLPLEHLRGIQKRLGIKGGRSRAQAAEKIRQSATEEMVGQFLLPAYREDFIRVDSPLASVPEDWRFARRSVVTLYLVTVMSFLNSLQQIAAATRCGSGVFVQETATQCPFCKPLHGKHVEPGKDEIPPFHPGCGCWLFSESLRDRFGG